MSMIDIHANAIESHLIPYHEFLQGYKKRSPVVYGFIEGKDDLSFYKGFIQNTIPFSWKVILWPVGNKLNVLKLYTEFDWNQYPKSRICFFLDRDFSSLLNEVIPNEINIYITDFYSIENNIVTSDTFERIMTELFQYSSFSKENIVILCNIFEKELESFCKNMIPIMAWILFWRVSGYRASLDNIQMKHVFSFDAGILSVNLKPRNCESIIDYVHEQCNLIKDEDVDISQYEKIFSDNDNYLNFTRGKYLFWFLIEISKSINKDLRNIIPNLLSTPRVRISLSESYSIPIIAPLARIPKSLKDFFNITYNEYVEEYSRVYSN